MSELNIGKNIVQMRRKKGITQDELALHMGVSKSSVSKWECGVSYPDIAFLPVLASFFEVSIDELIDYKPHMEKEDIAKLYHNLAKEFSLKPFSEVYLKIEKIIKNYYSCYPLLLQIGILLINHYMLADANKQSEILHRAKDLFEHISVGTKSEFICNQAKYMKSLCFLLLGKPHEITKLFEDRNPLLINESIVLSSAYSMLGETSKAREIIEIDSYQYVLALIQSLCELISLNLDNCEKVDLVIKRILDLCEIFEISTLHPSTLLSVYLVLASTYSMLDDDDNAFLYLDKYARFAVSGIFPLKLTGDKFFTEIDDWLNTFDLGSELPRDEKVVKHSIYTSVTINKVFDKYKENDKYKSIVTMLECFKGEN